MEMSLCEDCPSLLEFWTTFVRVILPAGLVIGVALSAALLARRGGPVRSPLRLRTRSRREATR